MGIIMNFKKLLQPYTQGGNKEHPVERNMGTIFDYLINKKGYPINVVGAAVFSVFFWLNTGNSFKGNGTYGSEGKELVTSIKLKCDEFLKYEIERETYKAFIEMYAEDLRVAIIPLWKRRFINWWVGRKIYNVTP